jgi:cytochrome c553
MRGTAVLALSLVLGYAKSGSADPAPAEPTAPPRAQRDYLLACGGCHGLLGTTGSKAVPQLKGLVGFYLSTQEGRSYLPRLPNVAFAALSDQQLAAVLNYVVFDFGGASVPKGAQPYAAAEVAQWRARPLTEVPLTEYRRRLVADLIGHYRAPASLGFYDHRTH